VAARPFTSVDELQIKGVVGEKTLEKLRPLVTAGPRRKGGIVMPGANAIRLRHPEDA